MLKGKTYNQEYSIHQGHHWKIQSYQREKIKWKEKSFLHKQKLKEFVTTNPALPEMLKGTGE